MQDRPQPIRTLLLHPENSQLETQLRQYFNDKDAFPITLIGYTSLPERCRSLVTELFPHVILLVDVAEEGSDWNTRLLQLSHDINRDYPGLATVLLTDAKQEEMNHYYEKALAAGVRAVVNVGRLGEGMVGAFGEIERAIMQAYEFIRNHSGAFRGLLQKQERKLFAVGSGKGGTGKSTVAAAFAAELARRNLDKKIVLVDFAVQFGAQAPIFGIQNQPNSVAQLAKMSLADIANIRSQQEMLDFVQLKPVGQNANLYLLLAPSTPTELPAISMEISAEILSTLRRMFDYVVIDLPAQITNESITAFQMSDLIFLVCEPELLSVRAARQLIQLLNDPTFAIPYDRIKVVINKIWGKKERNAWGTMLVKREDVEAFFPDMVVARFPYETQFLHEHISGGHPIGSLEAKADFLVELRKLIKTLDLDAMPRRPREKQVEKAGLLGGLWKR